MKNFESFIAENYLNEELIKFDLGDGDKIAFDTNHKTLSIKSGNEFIPIGNKGLIKLYDFLKKMDDEHGLEY